MSTPPPSPTRAGGRPDLGAANRFAVIVALTILGLRLAAWRWTGSVAVLADTIEPLFNLLAAIVTMLGVTAGRRPADAEHPFGHRKLEFVAVGFHGAMVLSGAAVVLYAGWWQWQVGTPPQAVAPAALVFLLSIALSALVARRLAEVGRERSSPALTAAAHHARLDVWVASAVLVTLLLAGRLQLLWLDLAVSIAVVTVVAGGAIRLLSRAITGLMDAADPAIHERVSGVLEDHRRLPVIGYHELRIRDSGGLQLIDFHLQFADGTSLEEAHDVAEAIETAVEQTLPRADAIAHLEPASEIRPERRPTAAPRSPREQSRRRAATISFVVAVGLLAMKTWAWRVTGSTAVLTDAAESLVNVAAAAFAMFSVRLSRQAADSSHPYGHHKVEYLAAAFEGGLIVVAAVAMAITAGRRLVVGGEPENLDAGLALVLASVVINGWLGWYLVTTGRRLASLTLLADGKHVLTDVWTSGGVLVGLLIVRQTGYWQADPICALVLACQIAWTGVGLVREAVYGVVDTVDPDLVQRAGALLDEAVAAGEIIGWHKLRARDVGAFRFADAHIQLPEGASLAVAHDVSEELERRIEEALGPAKMIIHAEPATEARPGDQPAF